MTYRELCERLKCSGVESPEWDAQELIGHFCGADRLRILADPDADWESDLLKNAADRRCAREPLQYILGEWCFYRQTYEVSPDCLIPRSDTECLVEEAVRRLPPNAFFADLCTGSGCIAVSTLAERPDTVAVAVELSEGALALARRNAARNGVAKRLTLERADVLGLNEAFLNRYPKPQAILSNPPYIRSDVIPTLQAEVAREPSMALDGGKDGLVFYRALVELADRWLDEGGFCLFEIGYDQGKEICELASAQGFSCEIWKDLGGCDRVAFLRRCGIS